MPCQPIVYVQWWIFPIAMVILCFIMMCRHRGGMTGGFRSHPIAESAREILDKRYALGEVSPEEYVEKKRDIRK
jgi:uncharacterized membrane protein